MSQAYKLLANWGVLIALGLLAGLPIYGPALAYFESTYFPVASKLSIETVKSDDSGIEVRYSYRKQRDSCEYLGGYVKRGISEIPHEPLGGDDPRTVGAGVTITRYWHIDAASMDGLEVWFAYRCHPFYILTSKVYP